MTNIYYTSDLYVQDIKKHLNSRARPDYTSPDAVTQHTTACCSMQVVDITLAEQASTNITSLRMVQQKHCGPKYKLIHILLQTKA
jgi:hypothetical protein